MSAAEKLDLTQNTDLVVIDATPAVINFNYEEVRTWLESELERYDVVVTADTLADSKKLATELNKKAAEISTHRKDAVAAVSAPIKAFDDQAKSLEKLCKDGRQRLLDQIQVFEDETRATVAKLLGELILGLWQEIGVAEEFRSAVFGDLVKLSALTKAGKLTANTISELKARVTADKQLQDQTERRLLMLENESYKAGLAAPLTRAHVNSFLFAANEEYDANLSNMMQSELKRQEVAEQRTRQQIEKEQSQAIREEVKPQIEPQVEPATDPYKEPQAEPTPEPVVNETRERFAYGPLTNAAQATIIRSTQGEVFGKALDASESNPVGIWTPQGLIAIAFGGDIFTKLLATKADDLF